MRRKKRIGKRHPLLLYQRFIGRLFWPTFLVGVALLALWWAGSWYNPSFLSPLVAMLVLGAGLMVMLTALFLLLAKRMTYVQTFPDHLRVITPFLRLKISYRRIRSVHSANIQQLFPPERAKSSERSLLEPFYGMTVVVIEVRGYPMSPNILRAFLPKQIFLPKSKGIGFVLITPDWMDLSTEIDSSLGNWRQSQTRRSTPRSHRAY